MHSDTYFSLMNLTYTLYLILHLLPAVAVDIDSLVQEEDLKSVSDKMKIFVVVVTIVV